MNWAEQVEQQMRNVRMAEEAAAVVMAIMALAEEQRTANMIAYLSTGPSSSFAWSEARSEIEKRIGLRSAPRR